MCFPVSPTWAHAAPQRAPCCRAEAHLKSNDWCHFDCLLFTARVQLLVQAAQGACRRPFNEADELPDAPKHDRLGSLFKVTGFCHKVHNQPSTLPFPAHQQPYTASQQPKTLLDLHLPSA